MTLPKVTIFDPLIPALAFSTTVVFPTPGIPTTTTLSLVSSQPR